MTTAVEQPAMSEEEVKKVLASLWWMPLVRGILLIIFGLLMFARPGATLLILIQFMGAYWLVSGIFDLVEGIIGHTERSRIWMIISAIISILAGFFVLGQPIIAGLLTATFLVYLIGIASIASGVMHFFAGRDGSWSWGGFFIGILYIIFGLIVVANPLMTEATLIFLLPIWAIITGIFAIVAAFMLRGVTSQA